MSDGIAVVLSSSIVLRFIKFVLLDRDGARWTDGLMVGGWDWMDGWIDGLMGLLD